MEGNKDEAEKCIELATQAFSEGNREKAERLLLKSEKLYPTAKAKALLERVRNMSEEPRENLRSRQAQSKSEKSKMEENKENDGNKEHIDAVKRIKKCKDYYEMLGVSKEATDSEIKKAYKKLALLLHPDKNKTPGAAEAFKALGNAAGVLTDSEKRKQYDLYGSDEERMNHMHSRDGTYNYTRGFEADVTAEELFNMFFGGGFPNGQNIYMRRTGRSFRQQQEHYNNGNNNEQHSTTAIFQLLPILVLIFLSMISSYFVADPVYSLSHTSKYPVQRTTLNLKVPYYVKENFHNEYQGSLRKLEISVEEDYINSLRQACYREKSYRESLLWKARSFGDNELFRKAQNTGTPSCDVLAGLHGRIHTNYY